MTFGQKLKTLRTGRNMTQDDLARTLRDAHGGVQVGKRPRLSRHRQPQGNFAFFRSEHRRAHLRRGRGKGARGDGKARTRDEIHCLRAIRACGALRLSHRFRDKVVRHTHGGFHRGVCRNRAGVPLLLGEDEKRPPGGGAVLADCNFSDSRRRDGNAFRATLLRETFAPPHAVPPANRRGDGGRATDRQPQKSTKTAELAVFRAKKREKHRFMPKGSPNRGWRASLFEPV